jgi:subfamily B ATP-binding cassette protein MsbA
MRTYLRLLRYVRPFWAYLTGSIICILFYTVFSSASLISILPFLEVIFYGGEQTQTSPAAPATPMPSWSSPTFAKLTASTKQKLYDFVLGQGKSQALLRLCALIIVLMVFKNIFDYLQSMMMAHVEQGVIRDLRNDMYRHLNKLSLSYFNRTRTGQLMSRITNDVNMVNGGISAGLVTLIKSPLLIVTYLSIAFILSWKLTLAALTILPLSLTIISAIGARMRRASFLSQEKMADVSSALQETITGARVVKAFAMEDYEIRNFEKETMSYFKTLMRVNRISKLAGPLNESLGVIVGVGILWFGGQQVLAGQALSPSEFILFLLMIFSVMQPVKDFSSINTRVQEAIAAGDRIFELLGTEPEIISSPGAKKVHRFERNLRFDSVTYAYEPETPVLRDVNVDVRKGQVLAIVGPSGAGKSTLVDLLPRFYDPTQGKILLDGVDLRELEIKSLRSLMGIVTQETILFHGSVRNNIAYGLKEMPEEKLIEAAQAANAHRFIVEMPKGYDTLIGERGLRLSGGQRQRLAIARALLKNPPILILDEATSALDSESELLVQQAIERLMANRTSFVIAHRLSTILHADQIIVLDRSRVVQRGTHEQLLQEKGIYQKLYKMQFRA